MQLGEVLCNVLRFLFPAIIQRKAKCFQTGLDCIFFNVIFKILLSERKSVALGTSPVFKLFLISLKLFSWKVLALKIPLSVSLSEASSQSY